MVYMAVHSDIDFSKLAKQAVNFSHGTNTDEQVVALVALSLSEAISEGYGKIEPPKGEL
jgi:hypothetical protein